MSILKMYLRADKKLFVIFQYNQSKIFGVFTPFNKLITHFGFDKFCTKIIIYVITKL